jgi:tRNA pseudouridine32 synthase/23S rRNA pseudouridine746 synthase
MTKATNPEPANPANDILSRVLHRDGLMLVIDKPAGIPVHRGPRNSRDKTGTALEDFFGALRFGLPRPPVLAHRLDRDTSGCLVLGRHRKATASLGLLFKHGKIGKTYWAVVEGGPEADEGTIDIPLGKLSEERGWWQKPDPNGLPSTTRWKVMGRGADTKSVTNIQSAPSPLEGEGRGGAVSKMRLEDIPLPNASRSTSPSRREANTASEFTPHFTWLALEPVTGRTHQLRVHCAAMGFPIVGDPIYGTAPREGGEMLHLHAREVVVPLSKNKPAVRVTAPVPKHMREKLAACGWREDAAAD